MKNYIKTTLLLFIIVNTVIINLFAQSKNNYSSSLIQSEENNSFIIIGDTQRACFVEIGKEKNDEVRPMILKKIADENPSFIIHLGDFVCFGSSKNDWEKFDDLAIDIRSKNIPILPVLGNHDYFLNDKTALRNFFSRFPDLVKQTWYSRTFNGTGFIFLNSNFDNLTKEGNQKQLSWYKKTLNDLQSDTSVKIIIICCHHAPFTNSTVVSDNKDVQDLFVKPMLNIPKAKLFFTGHCHCYEHFIMENKHFIVTGGGSGPRQKLSDKPIHIDTYKGGKIRNFHFCKATLRNFGILVQMIYIDDNLKKWEIGQEFFIEFEK
jgi:predicted phosphodiesterase